MSLGIDSLKKVVVAALHIVNKVDEVTEDGFQLVSDGVALVPNLIDLVSVIKNSKDAYNEFLDLDEDEKADLLATVKAEFDLNDDKLEEIVEDALIVLSQVASLVKDVKEALKK